MEAVRKPLDQFEAEAAIGDLVKLRADGGPNKLGEALEIGKEFNFDEKEIRGRFEEAELALLELRPEKILSEIQPIRVEPKVEVVRPVEVVKPKVEWRQLPNGGWEYRLVGENIFRRHFGPPPKLVQKAIEAVPQLKVVEQAKPEPEPEPKEEEKGAAVRVGLRAKQ